MKNFYLIITICFYTSIIYAQKYDSKTDEITLQSRIKKNQEKLNISEVHSLMIPTFNNDSLCKIYNNGKAISELGSTYIGGKNLDTSISLLNSGEKFLLDNGFLWIYSIESSTAEALGCYFNNIELQSGAYLSIYNDRHDPNPDIYTKEALVEKEKLYVSRDAKRIIIEYFVPNSIKEINDIVIGKISYGFIGVIRKNSDELSTFNLKSGIYGSAVNKCQHDVTCPEVGDLKNESNSVVFLRATKNDFQGGILYSEATGTFLNKVNGYSDDEKPIILTCGHLFYPELNGVNYDIKNNFDYIECYIHYKQNTCNETKTVGGEELWGSLDLIYIGNNYNLSSENTSEDFALLRTGQTVNSLKKKQIIYAGWSVNFDLGNSSNIGYKAIGHPGGDAQKVLMDNNQAFVNSNGLEFGLYPEVGACEPGFSGSAVFNNQHKIIGWVQSIFDINVDHCLYVGQNVSENRVECGKLDNIRQYLSQYIDPNFIGEAEPSSPWQLPEHCKNCTTDGDEEGLDCGGSCKPCGATADLIIIDSESDLINKDYVKARYEIQAGSNLKSTFIINKNILLEAGDEILIKNGITIYPGGGTFTARTNELLKAQPIRGCETSCTYIANVFTPNGDGICDFWGFEQNFVEEYNVQIFYSKYGSPEIVYEVYNVPVDENGWVSVWDGKTDDLQSVYFYVLEYKDCYGNWHTVKSFFHVFTKKSGALLTDYNEVSSEEVIAIYPNPASSKINISYILPIKESYEITLIDQTGKQVCIIEKNNSSFNENNLINYDVESLKSGIYYILLNNGEFSYMQKFIKE